MGSYESKIQYTQMDFVPGHDGIRIKHIHCHQCEKHGHFADVCPEIVEADTHMMSNAFVETTKKEESEEEHDEEVEGEELIEEVERNDELVSSHHGDDWGECPSNSDDSLIVSFQFFKQGRISMKIRISC